MKHDVASARKSDAASDYARRPHEDVFLYRLADWLDEGRKSTVPLAFVPDGNDVVGILGHSNMRGQRTSKLVERYTMATPYPSFAEEFFRMPPQNILPSPDPIGAVLDGKAHLCLAKNDGRLSEIRPVMRDGVVVASPLNGINRYTEPGEAGRIIAFEGIDGSGKTALSERLLRDGMPNGEPSVLMTPYSGIIGKRFHATRKMGMISEWADAVGLGRWDAPPGLNVIYDRNILTWMTDAMFSGIKLTDLLDSFEKWRPLPDTIMLCKADPKTAASRLASIDEFSDIGSLIKYDELFDIASEFVETHLGVKVERIDTNDDIEESMKNIRKRLA